MNQTTPQPASLEVRHLAGVGHAGFSSGLRHLVFGRFPNRGADDPKSIWHNYRGQGRFNMLFGDGHVVYFRFPPEMPDWIWTPVDPGFLWW